MDAEIKSKWIAALRSGDFQQGTRKFQRDDKFCCLGVLCVVAGAPTRSTISPDVGNWDFVNSLVGSEDCGLADKNDSGWSFSKIADYIEENL